MKNQKEEIRKVLNENIDGGIESYKDFHIGEFIEKPNQCGCFKRNEEWYIYQTDEKNYCTFCGPFSQKGIVYACTMILPVTINSKVYRFTEIEFNVYLHNHFHSFEEIDKNIKE